MANARAEAARAAAIRLMAEADALEANYIEEPFFEDGTGLIQFTREYNGVSYTYAAVRVLKRGGTIARWYITGASSQVARLNADGMTWDALLDFIRMAHSWTIWNAVQLEVLASSE